MNEPMITVPRQPTPKMIEAGRKVLAEIDPSYVSYGRVLSIWMDMLEAFELTNGLGSAPTLPSPNKPAVNAEGLHSDSQSRGPLCTMKQPGEIESFAPVVTQ